jgi:MFS transporter, DHA1 family, tetracycline resistance protein
MLTKRSSGVRRGAVIFVIGAVFLNSLGVGMLTPVLPRLLEELTGRGPESASLANGVLLFAYAGMSFLLSPFLGRLSDRLGRKPVLLLAIAGSLIDYALCAAANSFVVLLIARIFAGSFGASVSVANAALSDLTPPQERGRAFGVSSAVMGLGLIAGPVVSGSLMAWGTRAPFIAASALAGCELAFGLLCFPETVPAKSQQSLAARDVNPFSWLQRIRRLPLPRYLLLGTALFQLGGSITQSVLVLFAQAKFGWDVLQVGLLMTTLACTSVVIRWVGVRAAMALLGETTSIILGLCVFSLGTLALAFVNTGWELYAALIFGQCGTIAAPVMLGVLSRVMPAGARGESMGTVSSVMSVAVMVAPLVGAATFGDDPVQAGVFGGELVFVISALLLLLAVLATSAGLKTLVIAAPKVTPIAVLARKAQ